MNQSGTPATSLTVQLRLPSMWEDADIEAFRRVAGPDVTVIGEIVRPGIYDSEGRRVAGTMQALVILMTISSVALNVLQNVLGTSISDGLKLLVSRWRAKAGPLSPFWPAILIAAATSPQENDHPRYYATIPSQDPDVLREALMSLPSLSIPAPGERGWVFDPATHKWKPGNPVA